MRTPSLLCLAAAATLFLSSAPVSVLADGGHDHSTSMSPSKTSPSNEHEHGHGNAAPLLKLNETEVLLLHAPDPLSYYAHDIGMMLGEDGISIVPVPADEQTKTYGGLMAIHVACMVIAFFGILPIGIMLRSTRHPYHSLAQLFFLILVTVGWLFSALYSSLTPDLYPGQHHSSMGYLALLVVAAIALIDFFAVFRSVLTRFSATNRDGRVTLEIDRDRSTGPRINSWKAWIQRISGIKSAGSRLPSSNYDTRRADDLNDDAEYSHLVTEEPEAYPLSRTSSPRERSSDEGRHVVFDQVEFMDQHDQRDKENAFRKGYHANARSVKMSAVRGSYASDTSTLRGDEPNSPPSPLSPRHSLDKPSYYSTGRRRQALQRSNSNESYSYEEGEEDALAEIELFAPSTSQDDEDEEYQRRRPSRLERAVEMGVYLTEWGLVAFAWVQLVYGSIVYTGICRATYVNGCLAHTIKGTIFFVYGVATFCRYLGAFAKYGWSWNRAPPHTKSYPTAEMVESTIIFIYGATNTWLERTAAAPGAPYSTREIQHISIAVMYWFAGLVGMALESRRVRRLLALSAFANGSRAIGLYSSKKASSLRSSSLSSRSRSGGHGHARSHSRRKIHPGLNGSGSDKDVRLAEPPTYTGSFNPFPALCIGITGIAMAAHHQTYQFAVYVHMLWGGLLTAFSVMRVCTYIFLWLRPPTATVVEDGSGHGRGGVSVLPSRPPSEAMASFFLACGGLVFIASTEQIEFAAMRTGRDDIMMILNLVVAIVCFVFCWCVLALAIKGWAKSSVSAAVASRRAVTDRSGSTGASAVNV